MNEKMSHQKVKNKYTIKGCIYTKDPYETKYEYLINNREKANIDHSKDPKTSTEF